MNTPTIIHKNTLDLNLERSDFFVLLEQCREEKKFTNVQLQIGDQLFDAHRNILSLYSPVLEAAISDQWSTSKICPISDEYVDLSIVEPLLHFLYTGSIQLTPDNVHPVCVAAHFLQISTLLEPSIKHLCQLISVENALSLFEFSVACELETLRLSCLRIIAKNHEKVFQDPQILKFSTRSFNDLIAGLKKRSRPRTMLEENTFDCIARWTEVNLSERLNELPGLLKNIPLEELPLKFLTQTVSKHRLVKESMPCIQTVSVAQANAQPERGDNLVVLCQYSQKMAFYDSETKVWANLPDRPERRYYFAATVVNRKDIVICGGTTYPHNLDDSGEFGSVRMFEWSSQTWKELPKMPFSSNRCSIAELDGQLYVTGKEGTDTTEVVCYSFETQQWRYVKPMNNARDAAKLVEYDGYLYVFGGGTDIVERYDPIFDEWTCITEKPKSFRSKLFDQISLHQNKIYGFNSKYVEGFDPERNHWSNRCDLNTSGSIVSANERLLLAKDGTKWIYKFSFTTMKWTRLLEHDVSEKGLMLAGQFY